MSSQEKTFEIYSGVILQKRQIALHTYHIKIQSAYFSRIKYQAGLAIEVFLSNPYYDSGSVARTYSFWNYEPVYNTVDLAINTFSNGRGSRWVKSVQLGDVIFFKPPSAQIPLDETADEYLLIGDVTALSHLYEIHRAIAVSKRVSSLVFSANSADFFADIDNSFPLTSIIVNSLKPELIVEHIPQCFSQQTPNAIAYIFGDSKTTSLLENYLKQHPSFNLRKIHVQNFWGKE
ncbi:FAD-binding oxidoreductase [Flavobacterium sp. HSC-61S13]|uniref:FAD-binding oxidoreductase n=1 Tax=Flavobacterium sp. HSC-61S13 TaxID=2910963 RepID=UPI00209FCF38|nr:FAD-binding oxidoreductase [Flavobacterium sp. HSC-61S13]MCP1996079.1 NADPH-dependent ferric siderophore reductase [Flavobacterium sp. HSC-61S13]